jgi:ubiquitin-conjugating enzyme E2 Z
MATLSKRVPKEIAAVQTMRAVGIYYWSHEGDMRKGRALIIGPEDTPYAFCPLLFDIVLPDDYPFSPPKVTFVTSDGVTRFHPNLYVAGKVCLSILGTWSGPSWASIMSLSTVLLSIQSLLDNNPITNEPGWEKYTLADAKAANYADWVQHQLIVLSYKNLLQWKTYPPWLEFRDVLETEAPKVIEKLNDIIRTKAAKGEMAYDSLPYSMNGKTQWKMIASKI